MSEHLSECPNYGIALAADYIERDVYFRRCICDELRGCEKRVIDAAVQRVEALGNEPQPKHDGDPYSWSAGYAECQRQFIAAIKGDQP
jgi:hypothetical protein